MSKKVELAKGIFVKERNEKTPDFVIAEFSVSVEYFKKWIDANKDLINDKGYLNLQALSSGKGQPYVKVNTYGL